MCLEPWIRYCQLEVTQKIWTFSGLRTLEAMMRLVSLSTTLVSLHNIHEKVISCIFYYYYFLLLYLSPQACQRANKVEMRLQGRKHWSQTVWVICNLHQLYLKGRQIKSARVNSFGCLLTRSRVAVSYCLQTVCKWEAKWPLNGTFHKIKLPL